MGNYNRTYVDNRKARFNYEILETFEAGIELKGTEVKSIKAGQANLSDAYAIIRNGEVLLLNLHISPHKTTSEFFNHDPRRTRRLLMHKEQIRKLIGKIEQKGLTLVPLKVYLKNGWIKVAIALARSKKLYDKREAIKKREDKREIARAIKYN
ncbi:SsrA-binding protein [Thalassoporum mexicanum PCC 7367]|uniref:SsrA-binding protein SmpB n=1 Tax=Thalassoporum mexicanum TaxID=3457544 RepID=UPI00029FD842|nr:SsrA-binding protein SmpB [Pseudanabaena sp. PCC 7367]AFY71585.1 SsrA-binding protein [Pseudanabaena sp. PCC 7367]